MALTHESTPSAIGRRLASARLRRGMSQGTVARLAGIAPSYLSRIETGKVQPTVPTVLKVARAARAGFEEILGFESEGPEARGACPVSVSGSCMLDLLRSNADVGRIASGETYSPRELRLLKRLAAWMQGASPDRLRAMEILLDDLTSNPRQ